MVYLTDIDTITSSTTLSTSQNTFLVDASGGPIIITLPLITTEGIVFKLIRIDTSSNTVTVQRTSPNLIHLNTSVSSTSVTLLVSYSIEFQSLNDNWYYTLNNTLVSFGSNYQTVGNSLTYTSTNPNYLTAISIITGVIPAGSYRISWFYNWGYSSTGNDFMGRVQLDGTTIFEHIQEPKDSNTDQRHVVSGFYVANISNASHTITLQYRPQSGGQEARLYNPRLEIFRIQ